MASLYTIVKDRLTINIKYSTSFAGIHSFREQYMKNWSNIKKYNLSISNGGSTYKKWFLWNLYAILILMGIEINNKKYTPLRNKCITLF